MDFVKIIKVDDETLARCDTLTRRDFNYAVHGVKSFETVEHIRAQFPKSIEMQISVKAHHKSTFERCHTEAVLLRRRDELQRLPDSQSLSGTYTAYWKERDSHYTVIIVPKSKHIKYHDTITVTRSIPEEKHIQYTEMFKHESEPAEMKVHSTWVVNFPHNIAVSISVITKKGDTYAQAVLTRDKKNFKPIKTLPVKTLDRPFKIEYDHTLYIVNLKPKIDNTESN